jgi:Leucine-rich repeat (LRR) protein
MSKRKSSTKKHAKKSKYISPTYSNTLYNLSPLIYNYNRNNELYEPYLSTIIQDYAVDIDTHKMTLYLKNNEWKCVYSKDYDPDWEWPELFEYLLELRCSDSEIAVIPDTLVNLRLLECNNSLVTEIPDTLVKLITLECNDCKISEIPDTLVNLQTLECSNTLITEIYPFINICR